MAAMDPHLNLTNEPICVWFWGHSFIRRLQDFCISHYDDRGNMGLVPESHLIFYKYRSGGMITDAKPDLKIIKQVDAELVFLDIGSNDLDSQRVSPQKLAHEVMDIAQLILNTYKEVRMVVICEILFRSNNGKYPLHNKDFVQQAHIYNNMVKILIGQLPEREQFGIRIWHHRGLVQDWQGYLEDGVHLNAEGMDKYQKSLRRAILKFSPFVHAKRQEKQ